MYYCKSRFYVPKWRRWLNSDSINYLEPQNITCLNLFAYCNNNPVMYVDENGHIAISTIISCIVGILLSGLLTGLSSAANRLEDELFWGAFTSGFIDGAVGSLAVAAGLAIHCPLGLIAAALIGACGGGLGNTVGQQISYGDVDFRAVLAQMAFSGITAGVSTFALSMTELFPRTGNFRKDFINNLSFFSSPDTPFIQRGVGIISLAITGFFSQYVFPNPNSIIIAKKNIKNSPFELYI